jgi:hypothetical protein
MNELTVGGEARVSLLRVLASVVLALLLAVPIFTVVFELLCQVTGAYPRRNLGESIVPVWIYSYLSLSWRQVLVGFWA